MFAPLPAGFPQLQRVTESLGQFKLAEPPAVEDIGVRMRAVFARARESGYQALSRSSWRRLPYALWVSDAPPLTETDSDLVRAYWDKHLPEATSNPRSAKRWLTPLFFAYCHHFRPADPTFAEFALRLQSVVWTAQGSAADWMRDLDQRLRWFLPSGVGRPLGAHLIQHGQRLEDAISGLQLWAGFVDEPLARWSFSEVMQDSVHLLSEAVAINRVKAWAQLGPVAQISQRPLRYPELRAKLADGLVRPWLKINPDLNIRRGLLSFLMEHFGDPRNVSEVHRGHDWQGVSGPTLATVRRWLVGDTLQSFMRMLELTADQIWRHRQRFWIAYYERGVIEEAWLALGSQASALARRELGNREWSQYGTLYSGATPNQSVLILRIGGLLFYEWSHNGSLRACHADTPGIPAMYKKYYEGDQLRSVESLDFHHGQNMNPQLTHAHSDAGTWQRKARDFIAQHTGVRLNDRDIIA